MSFCLGSTKKRGPSMRPFRRHRLERKAAGWCAETEEEDDFYGRRPGEKSHWSGEAVGPWKPVAPTKVFEVRYDHFGDGRFRHGVPSFECAWTNCLRTAYSNKWSNRPRSRT
jgi:hypothetical protein